MSQQLDNAFDWQKIAKERLLWMVRPMLIIGLVTWVLLPWTTAPESLERNSLIGFLGGSLVGVLATKDAWLHFLITRRKDTKHRRNRVPDEYYFGKVIKILQWEGETKD